MSCETASAATRTAFLMAFADEPPCATMAMPFKPIKRRAAVVRVVETVVGAAYGRPGSTGTPTGSRRLLRNDALEHRGNELSETLHGLQRDVAGEAVTDHDLDPAVGDVPTLHVTHEVQARGPRNSCPAPRA